MRKNMEAAARPPNAWSPQQQAWFAEEDARAVEDFWSVYDAHFEAISASTLRLAEGHPELAELVRAMSPEELRAQSVESRERLRRAIAGDWSSYESALRTQGATYARLGISFGCWSDVMRDFHGQLVPRLVQTYAREPERLTAALLASQELADRALSVLAEEYIQTKQTLLVEAEARERRRSEQALVMWKHVFDQSDIGVVISELSSNRVRFANDAYARLLERPLDQIVGQPREPFEGEELARARHRRFEAVRRLRDGAEVPLLVSTATTRSNIDDEGLLVTSVVDLRERKRTEEMARRSAELATEYERVQAATRLKSEFLANMSHELRTPLNSIIGFAELLHDGVVEPTSPEHHDCLRDILTSGRHLLQLINDVLDLAKVESGKIEFRPELVDLRKIVSEVVAMLRTISAGKSIRIDLDVDHTLDDLQLDPARLKQVLYNYLSNALKFTPPGGHVVVRARDELDAFWIEVEDTGIGIAVEDLDRLFVEFQQLDAGSAKEHGGTGLGLALTKRIVEAQGGRVGVRSKVGEGSVFFATLPRRVVGLAAAPLPPRFRSGSEDSAPRVLVVEDDARDQALLVSALASAGYAIETVVTGRQAIERCKEESFDAITLDLLLPDMSGLDVLAAIRSEGRCRSARVIVVTVVGDRGLVSALSVDDVLSKPVNEEQLVRSLRRVGVSPESGGRVLVIDDDAPSRRLMQASLSQRGFVVTCEPNGERGLAAVERELPDAVVLDLLMPEMDGFEFLSRFRADPARRDVPVLIWTMKNLSEADQARLRCSQSIVLKGSGPTAIVEELRTLIRVDPSRAQEALHGR
jgi:signal transduction histidine kinase/DNA-binding response OmpR family regulator